MTDRVPLKFENTAQVGDLIKAWDHQPRAGVPECYLTGTVTAKGAHPDYGFQCYTVRCELDATHDGGRIGKDVFVPFQVSPLDWDGRVELLQSLGD